MLSKFKENLDNFKVTWKLFTAKTSGGRKINEKELVSFFKSMNDSIGMPGFADAEVHK